MADASDEHVWAAVFAAHYVRVLSKEANTSEMRRTVAATAIGQADNAITALRDVRIALGRKP